MIALGRNNGMGPGGRRSGARLIGSDIQHGQFGRDFEIILFGRRRLALL
jgi:hypothetical protein